MRRREVDTTEVQRLLERAGVWSRLDVRARRAFVSGLEMTGALEEVRAWLHGCRPGLALLGGQCGKTVAGAWAVTRVPEARYTTAIGLVALLRERDVDELAAARWRRLERAPLLVVDELEALTEEPGRELIATVMGSARAERRRTLLLGSFSLARFSAYCGPAGVTRLGASDDEGIALVREVDAGVAERAPDGDRDHASAPPVAPPHPGTAPCGWRPLDARARRAVRELAAHVAGMPTDAATRPRALLGLVSLGRVRRSFALAGFAAVLVLRSGRVIVTARNPEAGDPRIVGTARLRLDGRVQLGRELQRWALRSGRAGARELARELEARIARHASAVLRELGRRRSGVAS